MLHHDYNDPSLSSFRSVVKLFVNIRSHRPQSWTRELRFPRGGPSPFPCWMPDQDANHDREKETDSWFPALHNTRGLAAVGKITWGRGGGFMDLTRRNLPSRAVASRPFWVLPWLCEEG